MQLPVSAKSGRTALAMFESSSDSGSGDEHSEIGLDVEDDNAENLEENSAPGRSVTQGAPIDVTAKGRLRSLAAQDIGATNTEQVGAPAPSAKLSLFDDISDDTGDHSQWDESAGHSASPHRHIPAPSQVRGRAPSFFLDEASSDDQAGPSLAWASSGHTRSTPLPGPGALSAASLPTQPVVMSRKAHNQLAMFDSSSSGSGSAGFDLGSSDGDF
eukprot:Colp12_sorted_trinity150504_noHs@33016